MMATMTDIHHGEFLTSSLSTSLLFTNQTTNRSSATSPMVTGGFMQYLHFVYLPALVVFGIIGNITCAIVFTTKSLRRLRSSAYLFTLALSDIFFVLDLLPAWISTAFVKRSFPGAGFVCKIQTYISFMAPFVHIWMVLAFTAERFFAVNFPLKHMSQCTPNVSRFVILIIVAPSLIFYIYPSFFASEIDSQGQCREKSNHVRFLNSINLIDTIMTMFLPFIVVSILNILIIRKLFCSETFRQHVFANGSRYHCRRTSNWSIKTPKSTPIPPLPPPPVTTPQSSPLVSYRSQHNGRPFQPINTHRTMCIYRTFTNSSSSQSNLNGTAHIDQPAQTPVPPLPSIGTLRKQQQQQRRTESSAQRHVLTEVRLTKMLLAISLTCLSLNFPSYCLRLVFFYERSRSSSTNKTENAHETNDSDFKFHRDVLLIYMSYLSYAINLFIYILFGGNFRRALKRLCSISSQSKYGATNLRGLNSNKKFRRRIEHDANSLAYSTATTCSSANSSLRSYSKSLKLREQASLRRTLRQQQILMSQQKLSERAME